MGTAAYLIGWTSVAFLVGYFKPATCAAVHEKISLPSYRVIAYVDGDLVQDNPNKTAAGEKPVAGDIIDVLDVLAKATNFSYTVTAQHQKAYGKKLPNGKWDGMIGALIDDKADIAVAPWVVTPERAQVVKFVEFQHDLTLGVLVNSKFGTEGVEYFTDEISSFILKSLHDPKAKALSDKLAAAKNKTLVDDNAEAANKVLSGKFAYVTDNDSVDKLAASSPGALGKENITIAAPGFSLAGYAVKKDSPKTAEVVRLISAIIDGVLKEEQDAKTHG